MSLWEAPLAPIRFEKDFYQKVKGMKQEMSKKWLRRSLSLLLVVLTFATSSLFVASAHQRYPGIALRWSVKTGGKCYLRIHNNNLKAPYTSSSNFTVAAVTWGNSCPNEIKSIVETSTSDYNINVTCPGATTWSDLVGSTNIHYFLGFCVSLSTDNRKIMNVEDAKACSRKIKYATIYLTPHTENFASNTHIRAVMVHEIGHALCLGHTTGTSPKSIMQSPPPTTWYLPADHDKRDITAWY